MTSSRCSLCQRDIFWGNKFCSPSVSSFSSEKYRGKFDDKFSCSLLKNLLVAQMVKNLSAVWETQDQSLGWEDPPGEGNGNPLQYSCLENSMKRGTWRAIVHGSQRVGCDWVTYTSHWRRWWHPTPVLLPGKSHGQRSLIGCSPRGCEESDTTERLPFHFSLSCIGEGNGNPLQCSCLESPRDGGAWWAALYGVAQSRTQLKWLSSSSHW